MICITVGVFPASQEARKNLFTTVMAKSSVAMSAGYNKKATSPLEQIAAHATSPALPAAPGKQRWSIRGTAEGTPRILVPTRLLIGPLDTLCSGKGAIKLFCWCIVGHHGLSAVDIASFPCQKPTARHSTENWWILHDGFADVGE